MNAVPGWSKRIRWASLLVPVMSVAIALAFVWTASLRWNAWIGSATSQVTDDANVRAHITHLAARASGQIRLVAVTDFQQVRAGDLLVEIDQEDYLVAISQAEAGVAAASAALNNVDNQLKLQSATIGQAEAAWMSALAHEVETRQEEDRQRSLIATGAGTHQRFEQAVSAHSRAQADVKATSAFVDVQKHQIDVLEGTKQQRKAELLGAQAALSAARLRFSYTRIVAPFDGFVSERQVQPGDFVNIGTSLISVVPLPNVFVIANYKETQLAKVSPGQHVDIWVDTFPDTVLRGRVERIAPASTSQFALLPPDNATGNFTKVVNRISVRIVFDPDQPLLRALLPGMSVVTRIRLRDPAARSAENDHHGASRAEQ